jgi:hypothetical protein
MKSFKTFILEDAEQENGKSGKKVSVGKTQVKINPNTEELKERADTWHPDPVQDRKLGGPGANQRAREDRADAAKPKEDPKKLKPGESYMDYAKRQSGTTSTKPAAKPSLKHRLMDKLGKAVDKIGGINNSYEPEGEVLESAVPGQPAERLGAVTAIPQSEREAAKARLLAKTAAKRKELEKMKEELEIEEQQLNELSNRKLRAYIKKSGKSHAEINKKWDQGTATDKEKNKSIGHEIGQQRAFKTLDKRERKEEFEIEEGMTMKDFKANRKKIQRKEASVDAEKRGHVGKEWHNTGRKYSPDEAKSRRANMSDDDRAARHRSAVDPDDDRDENTYSANKTKNPKKLRKQKAMGESLSFSDFMEARRMDKEGVDRGDAGRSARAERAKASVAAVKKRQAVLDKHEKKTGTKLDISKSVEGKAHAKNHPGSRQEPKVKGAKETPQETQNRRVNRQVARVVKHGHTAKEKAANRGIYSSRFD